MKVTAPPEGFEPPFAEPDSAVLPVRRQRKGASREIRTPVTTLEAWRTRPLYDRRAPVSPYHRGPYRKGSRHRKVVPQSAEERRDRGNRTPIMPGPKPGAIPLGDIPERNGYHICRRCQQPNTTPGHPGPLTPFAGPAGIEPATPGLTIQCSAWLSYGPMH